MLNGTRGIGNTTHIMPAYNKQSCGPRAHGESAKLASGRACAIPPYNDGGGEVASSKVISFSMKEVVGQDETILNDTARRSRANIDPVVAQILPNLATKLHSEMG